VSQEVKVGHGDRAELSFEAPPPPPEPEPGQPGYVAPDKPPKEPWHGLPPWVTATVAVATLGVTGVAVWSGLDTLSARDAYERWATAGRTASAAGASTVGPDGWGLDANGDVICPPVPDEDTDFCTAVQSRYDGGRKLERRTNILIGAAAGMAVVTAVMAIFMTDWKGKRKKKAETTDEGAEEGGVEVTAGFGWQRGGGMAMIEGRF
jgi:hypothetical protein